MNNLIVGGTFDSSGGKESHIVNVIANRLKYHKINGGYVNSLYQFRPNNLDTLIWMPNIDNAEDKILPRLKVINPKMVLISSKRVIETKYSYFSLVTRMINSKSNLCIIIDKKYGNYIYKILDP